MKKTDDYSEFMNYMGFAPPDKNKKQRKIKLVVICILAILMISLFVILLLNSSFGKTQEKFPYDRLIVSSEFEILENNHVGEEWSVITKIDGLIQNINTSDVYTVLAGDKLILRTTIIECDSYEDVGAKTTEKTITAHNIEYGFKLTHTINIKESNGRYAGNIAVVRVTYTFSPYKD